MSHPWSSLLGRHYVWVHFLLEHLAKLPRITYKQVHKATIRIFRRSQLHLFDPVGLHLCCKLLRNVQHQSEYYLRTPQQLNDRPWKSSIQRNASHKASGIRSLQLPRSNRRDTVRVLCSYGTTFKHKLAWQLLQQICVPDVSVFDGVYDYFQYLRPDSELPWPKIIPIQCRVCRRKGDRGQVCNRSVQAATPKWIVCS